MIVSRPATTEYLEGYERIFSSPKAPRQAAAVTARRSTDRSIWTFYVNGKEIASWTCQAMQDKGFTVVSIIEEIKRVEETKR